jgi:hypothetical protein
MYRETSQDASYWLEFVTFRGYPRQYAPHVMPAKTGKATVAERLGEQSE